MPQLDVLSFSSELIWFLLLFFSSFFAFVLYFLPNLYAVLRTREKRKLSLYALSRSSELNIKSLESYLGGGLLRLVSFSDDRSDLGLELENSSKFASALFKEVLRAVELDRKALLSGLAASYYFFYFNSGHAERVLEFELFLLDYRALTRDHNVT